MIRNYVENIQLYILLFTWVLIGAFAGPAAYVVIPITMLLLYNKNMYLELFIGFLFILMLSDSLDERVAFAKDLKNIYITLLTMFVLKDSANFAPFNTLYKLFVPFFIFTFFTILLSFQDPFFATGMQKTVSYVLVFLIIPNLMLRLYREHGPYFFKTILYFCFFMLVVGFVLYFIAPHVSHLETGRYRGVMGNPNGLGLFCLLVFIIFFVVNYYFTELFSKLERVIIYVAILFSIYLTDSRSAIFAIMIFYVFQKFFSFSPFIGFIVFLATLVLYDVITANFTSIILSLGLGDYFRVRTLEEGSGRYIAWEFAWKQIQHNFFIGKGFAYDEYYMRQNYGILQKMGHQGGIHNSFLTFWFDHGLIGLLLYLRSYILMFIKASRNTKYAFPIMFAISFTAMFESWLIGSLSAYSFLALCIYTLISDTEFKNVESDTPEDLLISEDNPSYSKAVSE
ncbi:MAG: O-antigen ligase family protein [Bacteroidota bacterium]|nr:O-antigen ligase family protein [Bacteroidota bacterium]